jgi:transposase-like protein
MAEMQALLAEHAESGLSLAAFARQRGVSVRALYYWKGRLGTAAAAARKPASRRLSLAPVKLLPDQAEPPRVEIELRSGRRLRLFRGFDVGELPALIAVLESC